MTWVAAVLPDGFFGHFGVALFFLISGFVIPFSLLNRSAAGFSVARVLRIWPTYVVGLCITVLAVAANARYYGNPLPFDLHAFVVQVFFVRDVAAVPTIDGISWTLEIEIKFYLLCVVIARALRAGSIGPVMGVAALFAVVGLGMPHLPAWAGLDLQMITFMLIGVLFNALYRGASRGWAIVGMTMLGVLFAAEWHSGMLATVTVPGLESYGLAFAAFGGCYIARRRIPTFRIAAWFADVSYPLYVVHGVAGYVLIGAALRVGLSPVAAVGFAFGCAVAAAWLLHVAVELPTQRIGQTLARRAGRSVGDRVAVS